MFPQAETVNKDELRPQFHQIPLERFLAAIPIRFRFPAIGGDEIVLNEICERSGSEELAVLIGVAHWCIVKQINGSGNGPITLYRRIRFPLAQAIDDPFVPVERKATGRFVFVIGRLSQNEDRNAKRLVRPIAVSPIRTHDHRRDIVAPFWVRSPSPPVV
jgi:hypothetical protein